MSVAVTYVSTTKVVETLTTNVPAASSPQITHDGFNTSATLNGSSTPPATVVAALNKALAAGTGTIDLTAVPGTNGATIDMSGLKVQLFKAIAKVTNANPLTITVGASNGYQLGGAAWKWILNPGDELTWKGTDAAPDVAAGAKTIDLAGTGTQSVDIMIVAG